MSLRKLYEKAQTVHTVKVHNVEFSFKELGTLEEARAIAAGENAAMKHIDKPDEQQKGEFATLYKYLYMIRAGGEDISDDEFLGMGFEFQREIIYAIQMKLETEVHTEVARMQQALQALLAKDKDKKLEKVKQ